MEFDGCNHVVIPSNRHLHSKEAKHKWESNYHSSNSLDHNGLVDIPTLDQYVDSTHDHNPLDALSDYEYHYLDDTYNCMSSYNNDQSSDTIDEFSRDGLCHDYLVMMNDPGFNTLSPPINFVTDEALVMHPTTTSGGATPASSSTDRVADDDWSEYDWCDLVQPIEGKESPSTSPSPSPPTQNQANRRRNASKALSGLTPKKPRKERGPKLAFKMEIDVDVIDDGYKWRKYGQKAVKNSPYPRGYYKCTSKHCNVKKHVERQLHEPKFVITTYEGVHNHLPPDQQLQGLPISSCFAQYPEDAFHFMNNYKRHLPPMDFIYHT